MGAEAFHLEKAQRNEQFYRASAASIAQYPEWGATILFYASLHYVDAWLAHYHLGDPANHKERNASVKLNSRLAPIGEAYMKMYLASLKARYTTVRLSSQDIRRLEEESFSTVRRMVRESIGLPV